MEKKELITGVDIYIYNKSVNKIVPTDVNV